MIESIEEAMEYIKGYCSKHIDCKKGCRLFDETTGECFLYGDAVPCDWKIERESGVDG